MKKVPFVLLILLGLCGPYIIYHFIFGGMDLLGTVKKSVRLTAVLTFVGYIGAFLITQSYLIIKQETAKGKMRVLTIGILLFFVSAYFGTYLLPTYKAWV